MWCAAVVCCTLCFKIINHLPNDLIMRSLNQLSKSSQLLSFTITIIVIGSTIIDLSSLKSGSSRYYLKLLLFFNIF